MAFIPTEPIGSIPRPQRLIEAMRNFQEGRTSSNELQELYETAIRETIAEFEATGSPVITDGEQSKPSFATYPIQGLENVVPAGVTVVFADGHQRQLPQLNSGPFRYKTYVVQYLQAAQKYAKRPVKQAVISASMLSLLYPQQGIEGYSREDFLGDLVRENEQDIRAALRAGAHVVQIDFTEGRLAVKLDPSKRLLHRFIDLNNQVLSRFSDQERIRIGIHTCPGGDRDSTHSADVDYGELLPDLFQLDAGNFYVQMASEPDRIRVLELIRKQRKSDQKIFIGVTDPISQRVETPEEIQDQIVEAAGYIPLEQLGTTDDCGFSPFGDDTSTSREIAFQKIRARLAGTHLAEQRFRL